MESVYNRPRWGKPLARPIIFLKRVFAKTNNLSLSVFNERAESMKAKSIYIHSFLLFFLIFSPVNSFAQLFGADDEDLAKIEFELKKFNTHLKL